MNKSDLLLSSCFSSWSYLSSCHYCIRVLFKMFLTWFYLVDNDFFVCNNLYSIEQISIFVL
jgi:hypothetical protein